MLVFNSDTDTRIDLSRPEYGLSINRYMIIVAAATLGSLAVLFYQTHGSELALGPRPVAVLLLFLSLAVSMIAPIRNHIRNVVGYQLGSWSFIFSIVLLEPSAFVVVSSTLMFISAILLVKQPLYKLIYNFCQNVLSVFVGIEILRYVGYYPVPTSLYKYNIIVVSGMVLACIAIPMVNIILFSIPVALNRRTPLYDTVKVTIAANLRTDFVQMSYAPIGVLILLHAIYLYIFFLVIVMTSHHNMIISQQKRYEANHDALTNLYNRRGFGDQVSETAKMSKRKGGYMAIMVIDLDGFKAINDNLGHHVGDATLLSVAKRMSAAIRNQDLLARFGGDEFVVLVRNINTENEILKIATRILASFEHDIIVEGVPIHVGCSLGISINKIGDSTSTDRMIQQADIAMYKAKNSSDRICVYSTELDCSTTSIDIAPLLMPAIKQNQFSLVYQPIVDAKTLRIKYIEALVRWDHPDFGSISPKDFVPILEQTELIHDFTNWLVNKVVQSCSYIKNNNINIPVSFNVFSKNLYDSRFFVALSKAMDGAQLPLGSLVLEIRESALSGKTNLNPTIQWYINNLGLELIIDDFRNSSTWSSIVNKLNIAAVKVDEEFISCISENSAATESMKNTLSFIENMGYATIAEGVESPDALNTITSLGFDFVQGYLISRPLSLEDIIIWVQKNLSQRAAVTSLYK